MSAATGRARTPIQQTENPYETMLETHSKGDVTTVQIVVRMLPFIAFVGVAFWAITNRTLTVSEHAMLFVLQLVLGVASITVWLTRSR